MLRLQKYASMLFTIRHKRNRQLHQHNLIKYLLLIVFCISKLAYSQTTHQELEEPIAKSMLNCSQRSSINYDSFDKTVNLLRQKYQAGEFSELEDSLNCLLENPKKFRSGRLGSSAAYWMFRRQLPAPGVNPDERKRVLEWLTQHPNSIFAELAELRLMYALAWNKRGSAYVNTTPEENLQSFIEQMKKTEQALLHASKQLRQTALWHNLYLAVILDLPKSTIEKKQALTDATKRWPDYYDFYELTLTRLVPKWGGSWELVDSFIKEQSTIYKKNEGDTLYARLYASMVLSGVNPFDTKIEWPRMKTSLEELIIHYPDPLHKNLAASFACVYNDLNYLQLSLNRLIPMEIIASAWIGGADPISCKRVLTQ